MIHEARQQFKEADGRSDEQAGQRPAEHQEFGSRFPAVKGLTNNAAEQSAHRADHDGHQYPHGALEELANGTFQSAVHGAEGQADEQT